MIRAIFFCAAAAAVLLLLFSLMDNWGKTGEPQRMDTITQDFMEDGVIVWENGRYRKTPNVTNYLIAGIDQASNAPASASNRYRNGGQADYLLLLSIDHTNRKIYQLPIDRDTMTDVTVLSVYGKETGTRVLQISLAHSYGSTKDDNARYTVRAVRHLLNGIEIAGYYMMDYTAVPTLNDTLGGVTVTIPDDMTGVNPLWVKGAEITLHGDEAEAFVRSRKSAGQGTNAERMARQNEFITSAIRQIHAKLAKNADFAARLLTALRKNAVTNIPQQQLLLEINEAHGYEIQPASYLEGDHLIAENGFAEFYADENSILSWIMTHQYTRQ